jgi:hypothetical protein
VFLEVGKFDENCRMMEDIELGYKLKARNHKIRLIKDLLVKHLKHYSFTNLLKSDVLDRAVPWTMLMLKNRQFTSDLNLKPGYKLSALTLVSLMISAFLIHKSIWFVLAIPVLMAIYFLMNYEFYRFFLKKKGPFFTLKVIPLHFLYYLYSSVGFLMGCGTYLFDKYRARR